MRIIHLSDQFHPWMGYQETYLAKEHTRMGHDVLVIAANKYGKRRGTSLSSREAPIGLHQEYGVQVLRLPVRFDLPTEWAEPWLKGLSQAIRDFSPDIIHAHGILSFSNVRAALLKKRGGFGLIIDCHRSFLNVFHPHEDWLKRTLKTIYYKGFAMTFGIIHAQRADAIVAIGEPEKVFAEWFFGSFSTTKIPIIRLGADHRRFQFDSESRTHIRQEMGWEDDDVVLGHAGYIDQEKGVDTLFDAIPHIPRDKRGRLRIHLVGNITGKYLSHLQLRSSKLDIASQLHITPFIPIEELIKIMSAWDIAIWAGLISNTALEAMSMGLPIITSRNPYTEYMVEKYDAGAIIEMGNSSDLAYKLHELVDDEALRRQKGQNARDAIIHDLNWEKISSDFIELYEKIIRSRDRDV